MSLLSPNEAQKLCTSYTKESGSNFYYSFLFLPRPRREAMYTIYALCRMVDSAVDDPQPGSDPLEVLATWRKEVSAAYQGHPTLPVTISLASHLQEFDIPEQLIQELITGVEMDLTINRLCHIFRSVSLLLSRGLGGRTHLSQNFQDTITKSRRLCREFRARVSINEHAPRSL